MMIHYEPIGVIYTPFKNRKGMPIQPPGGKGIKGKVEVFREYVAGLTDLEGFSHIILLYHFHRAGEVKMTVQPFLDDQAHGVFATRAPNRPNSIGLSVVRLLGIEGNLLEIANVDILDGTPLLDIKPYVNEFDQWASDRQGWLSGKAERGNRLRSDNRFA